MTTTLRSVHETRRINLRRLIEQQGGPTAVALRLGYSNGSFLAHLAGPHPTRQISEKVARGIERKLALRTGWLDAEDMPHLDDVLLAQSIQAVTAVALEYDRRVQPAKFAELVSIVYDHAVRTGECDTAFVQRLVRLTL